MGGVHVENQPHLVEIAAALKEITAQITSATTLPEAITGLLGVASEIFPGHVRAGVTLISEGKPATYAATNLPVAVLDEGRTAAGDGPGMDAVRSRDIVLCQDLAEDARWPVWSAAARSNGIHGVLAYPFDVDPLILGSFNLYAGLPDTLVHEVPVVAMLLADHSSLLLRVRLRQLSQEGLFAQVSEVEAGDVIVERAIGIVMAQRGCGADQALRHLHDASTHLGIGLPSVAERLVRTVTDRGR